MKEQLDLVKFNLTEEMSKGLIKFNDLKKKLLKLRIKQSLTNEEVNEIQKLENELNKTRIMFIKEFRRNNKEEIIEYLKLKDQN